MPSLSREQLTRLVKSVWVQALAEGGEVGDGACGAISYMAFNMAVWLFDDEDEQKTFLEECGFDKSIIEFMQLEEKYHAK